MYVMGGFFQHTATTQPKQSTKNEMKTKISLSHDFPQKKTDKNVFWTGENSSLKKHPYRKEKNSTS